MCSRKWEKAPPLLSDYQKRLDLTFSLTSGQKTKPRGFNLCLVWGLTIVLSGCAFDSVPPRISVWNLREIIPIIKPSFIQIASGFSQAMTISSRDSTNSESFSEKNNTPSGSGKTEQHAPAGPEQKPAILVPEIPNQDNGEVIATYKSTIEETQQLLRTVNESQLTKEQHDTYISINSFLEKAQEAFSQDDMSMAINLAEKAHTLTKEIANNSESQ